MAACLPVVMVSWCRDSHRCILIEDVVFVDPLERVWRVPAGFRLNGLSSPRFFWRVCMPYEGRTREASVVHDWLCVEKPIPSADAHWVFYSAMRANGVPWFPAFIRWLAVRMFGPRFGKKAQNRV